MYNFKKANWANLNHMLRKVNWSRLFYCNDINSAWNLFKSKLDQCIRVNIPTISIKSKYRPPWFDSEMHKLCIHKEKLRMKANKSGSEDELNKFKDARKEFRKKAKEKMNSFIADDPFDNENDIKKKFWSHVKATNKTSRIPETLYYRDKFCHTPKDNCELFNEYFADQFSKPSSYNIPINFKNDSNYLYNISEVKVYNLLLSINPNKAAGPDNIHGQILKNCASSLANPLSRLFNLSYRSGNLPPEWKLANIVPIFKKGKKPNVQDYRPISLTSLVMKTFETCIRDKLFDICKDKINNNQHVFLPQKSCNIQMINFC